MRVLLIGFLIVGFAAGVACGEEPAKAAKHNDAEGVSDDRAQFLITVAEYRLKDPIPVDATEADILNAVRRSQSGPVETVRMTVLEDTESMVNFGQQVSVTTGKVTRGPVTSRQTDTLQIGTILQLKAGVHDDGALVEISYATSRLSGEGTDESPPDVVTNTVQAVQLYEFGKQRLLSASSAGNAPCLVVTVRKMERGVGKDE